MRMENGKHETGDGQPAIVDRLTSVFHFRFLIFGVRFLIFLGIEKLRCRWQPAASGPQADLRSASFCAPLPFGSLEAAESDTVL